MIWASTYNNNGGDPTKGTYGVAIPAVRLSEAISSASSGALTEFPGLRDVPDFSSRSPLVSYPNVSPAYTNVGFVNPGDVSATLTVDFYSSDLATLFQKLGSEVTLTLNPNETRQITKALTSPVPTGAAWDIVGHPEDNYFMTVSVAGGGTVVPYTSVKDIGSSDSVFMTNDGSIASSYRVPAVVRANGQNGTVFRSRLVIFNPSGVSAHGAALLLVPEVRPGDLHVRSAEVRRGKHHAPLRADDDLRGLRRGVAHPERRGRPRRQRLQDVVRRHLARRREHRPARRPRRNVQRHADRELRDAGAGARRGDPRGLGGARARRAASSSRAPFRTGGTSGFRTNVALVLLSGDARHARRCASTRSTGGLPLLPEVSALPRRPPGAVPPAVAREALPGDLELRDAGTSTPSRSWSRAGRSAAYASINDNVTGDATVIVARPQH